MIYFKIIHTVPNKETDHIQNSSKVIQDFFCKEHELNTRTFELSFENAECPPMDILEVIQKKIYDRLGRNYILKIVSFRNVSNTGLRIFMAAENKADGHLFDEDDINALIDYIAKLLDMSGMTGELCVEDCYIPFDANLVVLN